MRVSHAHPKSSLSPKTAWTAFWFVVLGGGAFACYGALRPGTKDETAPREAPAGPLFVPSESSSARSFSEEPLESLSLTPESTDDTSPAPEHPLEQHRGDELCVFYKALRQLQAGDEGISSVRILHIGDSLSTTDEISGQIRRQLQARFGDGGHGFVLLGKPWRWYRHQDVVHGARGEWRPRPVTSDPVGDAIYGLGGVGLETATRGARAWVGPSVDGELGSKVQKIELSYLEQPAGGTFDILIDDQVVDSVSTRSPRRLVAHRLVDFFPGGSRLTVRARGDRWIRVFGATLDSGEPGVVYDTVAVNGARAQALNLIDSDSWAAEVARRAPSLLVFMLGANEGAGDRFASSVYKRELTQLLMTVRGATFGRACLFVGPLDQVRRDGPKRWRPRPNPALITEAQREVARENGCAFFDTLSAMGGPGSFATWLHHGLSGSDLLHLTKEGGRLVGGWIAQALLLGYRDWERNEQKCESNVTTL
jgi:lysophospholipase L1-like esterase